MNVPLLVARRHDKLVAETDSQDLPANKVPPSILIQPDEAPQKLPVGNSSKPIGDTGNLNEPVVPVEELRLLAKTRHPRKPRSGDRVRIAVFVAALTIIAAGAAGHRFLYAEASRAAGDVHDVVPEQPPSQPAAQVAKVEEANAATPDPVKAAEQEAPSTGASTRSAETVSAELLNQRLDAAVRELESLRALVQQLADRQEETTRYIAEVQAKEKAVRQPPLPPRPRAATSRKPAPSAMPPEPASAAAQVPQPSAPTPSPDSRAQIPRPPLPLRSD